MKKLIALVILATIPAIGACAKQVQLCDTRQGQVSNVAAVANTQLHKDMTAPEVQAVLGPPDYRVTYSGPGHPETWSYYVVPDCSAHLGITAPTTELVFAEGRLQRWVTYPGPPRQLPTSDQWWR